MTQRITRMKRNQIIQRWLQGIDDPVYDVFPTKKEGRYIVKLRPTPTTDSPPNSTPIVKQPKMTRDDQSTDDLNSIDNEPAQPAPIKQRSTRSHGQSVDSTVNLEILEQLRALGEELRNDRFKKEQKQYIKSVVNKELTKSRIRSRYVPPSGLPTSLVPDQMTPSEPTPATTPSEPTPSTPDDTPTPIDEPPAPPQFRSRIRRY